jgi:nuclear transport factor 2 (NTF2) superfamily protein
MTPPGIEPPITRTVKAKVEVARDAPNTGAAERVALASTENSDGRNRDEFQVVTPREAVWPTNIRS